MKTKEKKLSVSIKNPNFFHIYNKLHIRGSYFRFFLTFFSFFGGERGGVGEHGLALGASHDRNTTANKLTELCQGFDKDCSKHNQFCYLNK